jgi:hypothetical protein
MHGNRMTSRPIADHAGNEDSAQERVAHKIRIYPSTEIASDTMSIEDIVQIKVPVLRVEIDTQNDPLYETLLLELWR